ncbi:hypothetical protein IC006_0985 [Sulfuracidifex tepidarius]|uniref:Uncharacterized protein n=2 Tax=Sulfuracidifex tepidarius TaxID=1294262 RepID=A0A510DU47_9CREN|nr:hypothetical protein [Sulfuracidifex tepidarius]BBG23695.1 hypothetical protein IC006_0985 [Sulfuracidifex tepidarius]
MYEELFNQQGVSCNAYVQNLSSNAVVPSIKQYDDGISVDFGGSPYYVEYHEGNVQVWRDEEGRIVSIDVVYEDDDE